MSLPGAYEVVTASATAKGFTATNISPTNVAAAMYGRVAESVLLTVEGDTIRFRIDGTAPTTSLGHALGTGAILELEGRETISQFLAINTAASTSTVRATFFYGPKV
jgi:hypothetical protein